METNFLENSSLFDFSLDKDSKQTLKTTALWANISAVTGLITLAFGIYTFMKQIGDRYMSDEQKLVLFIILGVYVAIAFFLNFFILQFGNRMQKALISDDQPLFNNGLRSLKMYIRFWGILLIAMVLLFVIVLLARLVNG